MPLEYGPRKRSNVMNRIKSGESIRTVSDDENVSKATIYNWIREDRAETNITPEYLTENMVLYKLESMDVSTDDGWAEFESLMYRWSDWWDRRNIQIFKKIEGIYKVKAAQAKGSESDKPFEPGSYEDQEVVDPGTHVGTN